MERSEIRGSRIPLRFMRATGYVRAPDSRPRANPQGEVGRPTIPETKHARERMKPAGPLPDSPSFSGKADESVARTFLPTRSASARRDPRRYRLRAPGRVRPEWRRA